MDKSMTELRGVTCHMGSHSVTCHPTQVSAPRLNPSHTGRYSIYLPQRDGGWVDLVTRKRSRRESNSQPLGPESNALSSNHWATKQQGPKSFGTCRNACKCVILGNRESWVKKRRQFYRTCDFIKYWLTFKLLSLQHLQEICNKAIIRNSPTALQTRRYTTLWNTTVAGILFASMCISSSNGE